MSIAEEPPQLKRLKDIARLSARPAARIVHVLNLGAGVQSTMLALLFELGLIRWCDLDTGTDAKRAAKYASIIEPIRLNGAVFADTGDEPMAVYLHLAWLCEKVTFPIYIRSANRKRNRIFTRLTPAGKPHNKDRIRRYLTKLAGITLGSLGDDLTVGRNSLGGRFAAIPAFTTTVAGTLEGKTKRQCTKEYKTEVIERTIRREICGLQPRQRIKKDLELHQYLGLSYDEPKRIFGRGRPGVKARIEAGSYGNKFAHFPLYDMYLNRDAIILWLGKQGIPHQVPRSACVYCPFKSNNEWRRLRDEDPAGWERALQVDTALRTTGSVANRDMDQMMFVHKSCLPLGEAPIDKPDVRPAQLSLAFHTQEETIEEEECPDGICGV